MATLSSARERTDRRVAVWDLPLRLFHWALVAAIALAFLSSEEEGPLNQWHVMAGWVAGLLIVFRVVWGFVGGEHSRFIDFVRPAQVGHHLASLLHGKAEPSLGHNPLGAMSVLLLLTLVAATVWTGAFGGEGAGELHETIAWGLLALVALHVIAVIVMSVLERDNLLRAMVSGTKSAARHPNTAPARRAGIVAYLIAIAVMAGAVFGVLRYDPVAFTPRSAESFEHRADGGHAGDTTRREQDED